MTERMSREDLRAKVEWEGGVMESIDYGVTHDEVPEQIADLWQRVEDIGPVVDMIHRYLYDTEVTE